MNTFNYYSLFQYDYIVIFFYFFLKSKKRMLKLCLERDNFLKKKLIFTIILMLVFTVFSPLNLQMNTQASELKVQKEEILNIIQVIAKGVKKVDNSYELDVSYAKEHGLSTFEINNIKEYLNNTTNKEVKTATAYNNVDQVKKIVEETTGPTIGFEEFIAEAKGKHVSPDDPLSKTLKLIFASIVGMTIATTIVQDMWKLGVISACHKWGKNHSKVKKTCKTLGYW